MIESKNPLAVRSKKWIATALVALMQEKPFSKITIQEIAQKAELDRRTFYRNFESKEDILRFYVYQLSAEYTEKLHNEETLSIPTSLLIFCEVAYEHKEFISMLIQNNLSVLLLNVFDEVLPAVHQKVKDRFVGAEESNILANIDYVFAYNTGGFWNVLNKWFADGCKLTPQEVAEIIAAIIQKMF